MSMLVTGVLTAATLAGVIVIAPAVKQAIDLAPFLYANTRCSARTGQLLTQNKYSEILASSTATEMYGILEDSAYSSIVEHAKDFISFSKALGGKLSDDYDWLKSIVPTDIAPIIKAMQIKFEIMDIKELINNLKTGKPIGEMQNIMREEVKYKLQSVNDFASATSALEGTPYHEIFLTGDIEHTEELNTQLDYYYIRKVLRTIKNAPTKSSGAFLEYWRHLIDMFNIRLVFRKIDRGMEEVEFIEGGYLEIKSLGGVGDMTQLEGVLRESPYAEFVTEMDPTHIELAMTKAIKHLAGLVNSRHPLQSGYIVRFIILKEHELGTINLIAKLKEENFTEEDIRKIAIL